METIVWQRKRKHNISIIYMQCKKQRVGHELHIITAGIRVIPCYHGDGFRHLVCQSMIDFCFFSDKKLLHSMQVVWVLVMHAHLNEKDCCKTGALCFTFYFWLQPEEFKPLSLSQLSLGKREGTSWTGCQSIAGPVHRDRKPFMLIFIPMTCLESPINLKPCMSFVWREFSGENPQRHGEKMQIPHRKAQSRIRTQELFAVI